MSASRRDHGASESRAISATASSGRSGDKPRNADRRPAADGRARGGMNNCPALFFGGAIISIIGAIVNRFIKSVK
ncbi:hypothetical protein [Humibacter antri]